MFVPCVFADELQLQCSMQLEIDYKNITFCRNLWFPLMKNEGQKRFVKKVFCQKINTSFFDEMPTTRKRGAGIIGIAYIYRIGMAMVVAPITLAPPRCMVVGIFECHLIIPTI